MTNLNIVLQQQAEPDRRDLQAAGTHPAPCARHCEAKAFAIEIRSLKSRLRPQAEPVHGDIRALKYRIHELEGEVMGYKRMLDVAEAAPQRKPLTDEEIYECERIAAMGYQKHVAAIRGQQFTAADDPQWHFARAIEAAHCIQEPKP